MKQLLLVAAVALSVQVWATSSTANTANNCLERISSLPVEQQDSIEANTNAFAAGEAIAYVVGKPSMYSLIFEELDKDRRTYTNPLAQLKTRLNDTPDKTDKFVDGLYATNKQRTYKEFDSELTSNLAETQQEAVRSYILCQFSFTIYGKSLAVDYAKEYAEFALPQKTKDRIGYFDVAVTGGKVNKQVGTGNKFIEPKQWEGSRFLTINASFKNLDTESRLPVEGSLFINYDGKEYEFDSVEPIMMEGYNIWFKKINPLITMKTKLVYRIPDEIHGPVYWRPGRNPTDTKLWVGNIEAAQ